MIIDLTEGWPPAQEMCLVQSKFYLKDNKRRQRDQGARLLQDDGYGNMYYVAFDSYADQ